MSRSTRCSLKFATEAKREKLRGVIAEYSKVVNVFIEYFWELPPEGLPSNGELLKPIVDIPDDTWLTARLRKVAAREAISMISAVRERWKEKPEKVGMPVHAGRSMYISSTIAELQEPRDQRYGRWIRKPSAVEFDRWLHLGSIGQEISLDLPIRLHKHFIHLEKRGRRTNSYILTDHDVQFAFEIETGPKKTEGRAIGIDTGINALATLDDGRKLGTDVKDHIDRINRCEHGSKGQKRARRALKQRIDEVARDVVGQDGVRVVVVERLKEMNYETKVRRRLNRSMRRSLGAWNYRRWLCRIEARCEDDRVVFRSVDPAYTSQRCHACGHTERENRDGGRFSCRKCGHADDADTNAAKNILVRFTRGPYGAPFQPSKIEGTVGGTR